MQLSPSHRRSCPVLAKHADDPHLGSLDAIHLVCALELGPELRSFVTYDKTLARAATDKGLPLAQPR